MMKQLFHGCCSAVWRGIVVVAGRETRMNRGKLMLMDWGTELVIRAWWYSVGWDFKRFELDWRRQSTMGVVEESGRGEDGQLLSFGHVCGTVGS
jgi:hypothetical protein